MVIIVFLISHFLNISSRWELLMNYEVARRIVFAPCRWKMGQSSPLKSITLSVQRFRPRRRDFLICRKLGKVLKALPRVGFWLSSTRLPGQDLTEPTTLLCVNVGTRH